MDDGRPLFFPADEVRVLIEHTIRCDLHQALFGQRMQGVYRHDGRDVSFEDPALEAKTAPEHIDARKVPPELHLAGDEGVYLRSNGVPELMDPQVKDPAQGPVRRYVVYALGCHPGVDVQTCDEAKRATFGGSDVVEGLGLDGFSMATMRMPREGERRFVRVDISPESIEVHTETYPESEALRIAQRYYNVGCQVQRRSAKASARAFGETLH